MRFCWIHIFNTRHPTIYFLTAMWSMREQLKFRKVVKLVGEAKTMCNIAQRSPAWSTAQIASEQEVLQHRTPLFYKGFPVFLQDGRYEKKIGLIQNARGLLASNVYNLFRCWWIGVRFDAEIVLWYISHPTNFITPTSFTNSRVESAECEEKQMRNFITNKKSRWTDMRKMHAISIVVMRLCK